MDRIVKTETGDIRFTLEHKRIKNINLRIHRDGTIFVSAPRGTNDSVINAFVCSRARLIQRALLRISAMPAPRLENGACVYILGKEVSLKISESSKAQAYLDGNVLILGVRDMQNKKHIENAYRAFEKQVCIDVIPPMLKKIFPYFAKLGYEFPTVRYRYMKSCFGNCRAKENIITFSTTLAQMPPECVEYVIAHELCHLVHQDHSARFYSLLCELVPDYKEKKKILAQIPIL